MSLWGETRGRNNDCKEMIFSHAVASIFPFKHEAITNKMLLMIFSLNEASMFCLKLLIMTVEVEGK